MVVKTAELMKNMTLSSGRIMECSVRERTFDLTFGLLHTEKSNEILVKVMSMAPRKLPDHYPR